MRRHRQPCWSCTSPTPLGELIETHVYAGHTTGPGWWQTADRVIWLCPCCATGLRKPARPHPHEGR
jgi:hypothetical protein